MYKLIQYVNKKATIYDDVQDISIKYDFETYEDAELFIINSNKEILKNRLASYRYSKEVEGINFGGVVISTDRESQAQFNAVYSALREGITDTITWKGNGEWVEIDEALATDIVHMAVMHVQKCFKCEKKLSDEIDAINSISGTEDFDVDEQWNAQFDSL